MLRRRQHIKAQVEAKKVLELLEHIVLSIYLSYLLTHKGKALKFGVVVCHGRRKHHIFINKRPSLVLLNNPFDVGGVDDLRRWVDLNRPFVVHNS